MSAADVAAAVATKPLPSAPPQRRQRQRLVSFFKAYAPGRLESVDGTLSEFRGREESLFDGLVRKYGPEPPPEEDVAVAASAGLASPDSESDSLLLSPTAKGKRRVHMTSELPIAGAGTEPSEAEPLAVSPGAVALRPSLFSGTKFPATAVSRSGVLGSRRGEGLATADLDGRQDGVHEDNDANPYAGMEWSQANLAALLIAYYGHVDPSVVARAPREAAHYFGREFDLFDRLQRLYGSSPVDLLRARAVAEEVGRHRETSEHLHRTHPAASASGVADDSGGGNGGGGLVVRVEFGGDKATRRRVAQLEARLLAYYEEVAPSKLANASQLAAMFGGSDATEEQLLRRLEQQYGRRPPELSIAESDAAIAQGSSTLGVRTMGMHPAVLSSTSGVVSRVEEIASSEDVSSRGNSVTVAYADPGDVVPDAARRSCKRRADTPPPPDSPWTSASPTHNDGGRSTASAPSHRYPQPGPSYDDTEERNATHPAAAAAAADDESTQSEHEEPMGDSRHVAADADASTLEEAVVMDLMDDASAAKGATYTAFVRDMGERLWPAHTAARFLIAIADIDDAEDHQRRAIDVAEYGGFAAIKSHRRRVEQSQRLLATACAVAEGVKVVVRSSDEASPSESTTTTTATVTRHRDVYSAFDAPRPGVRCYRAVLEEDPDL